MEFSRKLTGATTSTLLLAVIAERDRHGYEIVQRVHELSEGVFRWREGTVYPALHRLEAQGFIRGEWQSTGTGRERRVYSITPVGKDEMVRQGREWSSFVSGVNQVLAGCHAI